ncbi:RDD family protein [Winogradskyella echinorum]|uniref:RDD family protein n=1 Tax=Winogradskyella echinorum TaxID=538189 RepID=A0ABR6Y138_9FLAO|nr:RDD family protein [Winogradskyella echinorum]MBC3845973.1 RDD family protein [Winogradskyella echinorum]MBC5750321.1 RDD family protein [Winogradskyella echinorum]
MKITNQKYKNLNLANEESRGENLIIDFIISSFFGLLVAYLTFESYKVAFLMYLFVRFLYYFGFELALGRTPGKYQTQTKVVTSSGNPPTIIQLLIRTLSRFISILSGVSDDERAIHDSFSNTYVIKDIELRKIEIKQPLILVFNQTILGFLIFYIVNENKIETLEMVALAFLCIAFISGLIFGIKKITASTSPKLPSAALKEQSVKPLD